MTYLKVCSIDLIPPKSAKSFRIDGNEVIVINTKGQLFCLQARCTHAGAPLAEGTIEDDIIICPWHGSKFRVSNGEMLKGPLNKDYRFTKQLLKTIFCM